MRPRFFLLVAFVAVVAGLGPSGPVGAADARLLPGFNFVAYGGATLPVEEALSEARSTVTAVWWFDPVRQSWDGWNPALPASLQGIDRLISERSYFVQASGPSDWTYAAAGEAPPTVVPLFAGGNAVVYGGATQAARDARGPPTGSRSGAFPPSTPSGTTSRRAVYSVRT